MAEHRQEFHRELEAIEASVIELFGMVAEDLPKAADALLTGNSEIVRALAEHTTVLIVETGSSEALDDFLVATRLPQWNQVRILPSHHLQEAIKDVQEGPPLS